uniref:Secreted protein n=1 Tax=Ditylenchus dipsaci TaxID=166011 RepID=A0A915E209_9BILA
MFACRKVLTRFLVLIFVAVSKLSWLKARWKTVYFKELVVSWVSTWEFREVQAEDDLDNEEIQLDVVQPAAVSP